MKIMKVAQILSFFTFALLTATSTEAVVVVDTTQNISCYQCIRDTEIECNENDLRPCNSVADRCVIHVKRDLEQGFRLKRECGLGPCTFDDDMAIRGLGWGTCDRSKPTYFCVLCCKTSGCNKNFAATLSTPKFFIIAMALFIIILLEIIRGGGFQPPRKPESFNR